jgi:hypothetical protein
MVRTSRQYCIWTLNSLRNSYVRNFFIFQIISMMLTLQKSIIPLWQSIKFMAFPFPECWEIQGRKKNVELLVNCFKAEREVDLPS